MDEKFRKRFLSFCNSLNALAEARQRDLTDSFVLSGTGALEIAPIPSPVIYTMIGYIHVISRYAELIL